jgi:hypothetical protein
MNDSNPRQPDLDWSQVSETVRMLNLAVAQIDAAMRDSNASVDVLTNAFTGMAGQMGMITRTAEALSDEGSQGRLKHELLQHSLKVAGSMQQAIMAFQFYDRMSQRLTHVSQSVEALSDLVCDKSRLYNPFEWIGVQEKIRARYTMPEEREMFDAVMKGEDVHDVLSAFMARMNDQGSDVELF